MPQPPLLGKEGNALQLNFVCLSKIIGTPNQERIESMEMMSSRGIRSNGRRETLILCVALGLAVHVGAQAPPELIIRNGLVVTADARLETDVRIRNGTIAEIGRNLAPVAGAREIDARGVLVLPGGVDPHSHLTAETPADLPPGRLADNYTRRRAA